MKIFTKTGLILILLTGLILAVVGYYTITEFIPEILKGLWH